MNPAASSPVWRSFNDHVKNLSNAARKDATVPSTAPGRLFNRELSWLQFNNRVLSEAANPDVPALERLRFAAIVSSNLDEFFMVRVADVIRRAKQQRAHPFANFSAQRLLTQIRDQVIKQKAFQAIVMRDLLQLLAKEGITIYAEFSEDLALDKEIQERLPDLKYIVRRNSEPLPPLLSDRIHVFVRFESSNAIVTIDDRTARLMELAPNQKGMRFALLERWVAARASKLFPNETVIEAFPFKLIRDADLRYRPDDDEDSLEEQIVEAVHGRTRARVVRLEVDAPHYSEGALFLASSLRLDSAALYRFDLPLDLRTLAKIFNLDTYSQLRYPPITPQTPPLLSNDNIFSVMRARDVLLHHPYDAFDVIVQFLETAAKDPNVTHISHTMYRTSRESPIMEALKEGVRQGKKVTAYVEIKARFDELNNVRWAAELRKAGVKVIRPLTGYKVHCKLTHVIRNENGKDVSYVHLGTGNYHPGTARQYTDLGLLTCNQELGQEIKSYFQAMAGHQTKINLSYIMAAPANLQPGFVKLIHEETKIQKHGGKGHIIAKMNSLVDPDIIEALYEASNAGVKIELLVRGICCLRPGVPGLSENITVTSIVDRFLEHSRVYYFRADGAKKILLSSADWMPRNFHARYEVAFPVTDPKLKKYIREVVLATSIADNQKAWQLRSDGTYHRVVPGPKDKPVRSQFLFEELARNRYKGTILEGR